MSSSLKVSVVIPTYNEEDTIEECLKALVAQERPLDEIIVVDNNSTDRTVEIVEEFCKKNSYIKLLTEQQQGVQFARSRGFNNATGNIIARIDADTIVDPGWVTAIEEYYSKPEHAKVGVANGRSWYYDLPFPALSEYVADLLTQSTNQRMAKEHSVYGSNMTLRRDAWEKIKDDVCMNFGIMEDQDLGFHVVKAGFITGVIPTARAGVSGRRMRMNPLRFWKYNRQWWMTYYNHGRYSEARKIRLIAWITDVLQAMAWFGLLFHNPKTNRFGFVRSSDRQKERIIP